MIDIFISYAQTDNVFPRYDSDGWIDWFHRALDARLMQIRGTRASIWRDKTGGIAGNSMLHPAIEEALGQTKLLVTVFSPAYIASEWCRKELQLFKDRSGLGPELHIGTRSRITRVIKLPVKSPSQADTLAEIVDVPGYDFFMRQPDGRPLELTPDGQQFYEKINSVAYDLADVLDAIDARGGKPVAKPVIATTGVKVYLAETSSDVEQQRERLRYELRQFGYTVLPDMNYRYDGDFARHARDDLRQSHASIHVIGASIGVTPDRSRESVVEIQYLAALEEEQNRPIFTRFCWMPSQLEASDADERHAALVARVMNDRRLYRGTLEDFKACLEKNLKTPQPGPAAVQAGRPGSYSVYLIFEPPDADAAKRIEDWLYNEGFDPKTPLRDGTDRERRKIDRDYLKISDAVLIYNGVTNEFWLKKRLSDLEKISGYGRKRPFLARGVVLADPKTPHKERFRERNYITIRGFDQFSPRELDAFASVLRSAANTEAAG
jgi:hypothetical protein